MSEKLVKQTIAKVFDQLADTLISGEYGQKPRVAITALGSEHGEDEVIKAAEGALKFGIDVTLIGSKANEKVNTVLVDSEDEAHKKMEELLDSGKVDAAVTMHYPFPIGVSTVGRIITPGMGKEMFIATTTGTSSTDKVEGMVKNAIYGIITAKACGIKNPTVGILNVDGARQTEIALNKLKSQGYDINFAQSKRSDGGAVMRGNDLLTGSADVMVMDSLTGNLMIKIFSSYTTGGTYESLGYGYGPGIGENFNKLILIISRASGAPLIEGAMKFAGDLIKGRCLEIAGEEFEKAKKAGLNELLSELRAAKKQAGEETEVKAPPKEVVTSQISGIEIMDLEDAVKMLWKNGVYAESGMGCTGPIILVNEAKTDNALKILADNGYIAKEQTEC
ncbi:MAG TPA: glycine/sarcosine/betaine reductase complex component C subunit alpha [Sedimentibacter sp.]|nr:glycine reductase [Sedimentibacter sp.]HHZ01141.1 glycine reductase [Tissierellia bacterium]HOK49135.1 glycine/sarcosine/betaine reductase complex component C subunit alpha [Sedimentibacter sp.]HOW23088.1 glycine/sarcosine/betaine reductase complex component C subunit alpha [Sedimentibacter sp.]HRC80484.1 glycine/sarcosine/betaine reductase complex component C subunit alpha [Sedimentibacter sp.]